MCYQIQKRIGGMIELQRKLELKYIFSSPGTQNLSAKKLLLFQEVDFTLRYVIRLFISPLSCSIEALSLNTSRAIRPKVSCQDDTASENAQKICSL